MPRFFIDEIPKDNITVKGGDARHIGRSLRMKIGDSLTFCHCGTDYLCVITNMSETEVICSVNNAIPSRSEPDVKLTIYQAFPKQDKFEQIIQKTVELGVNRIVPFISKRCVAHPDLKSFEKKLERYRKISEEAAKQAGRGIIPEISPLLSFDNAAEEMKQSELSIICYENEGLKINETGVTKAKSVAVMIGSEGGFEREEVDKAVSCGAVPVWLGERILRCETCPMAITAIIMNLTGNM